MSSNFRKAPLREINANQGWVYFQNSVPMRAWGWLGGAAVESKTGSEDTKAFLERAKAAGALIEEIPSHWIVIPTGFDLQVHLRHPGQPHKETLEGGLESALYGGFDSILTMPNTNPFLDTPEAVELAKISAREALQRYPVRVAIAASATKGMEGMDAADISALAKAGASAITDDGWGVKSSEAQERIFELCRENDLLFQQHAEMPGHKGVATKSPFQGKNQLPEYPRTAEAEMVRRDIEILRRVPGARYHILHISTRETLAEIRKAKAEGLQVTAEVTPHHLFFSNRDIPDAEDPRCTYFKMNPPLFDPEDRAALREALRDGTVDCVSTDHAPHEVELKGKGWVLAPFGTRGLETALPLLLTLVKEGELTLERLVEVFSSAPRKILNKAEFREPTGLLFLDPSISYEVTTNDLPGISENSCFLGARLHGRIEKRGEVARVWVRSSH